MSALLKELGIDRLDVSERLDLIGEIWDSIAESPEAVSLTDAQRRELDRRLARAETHPNETVSWEQVRADAAERRRR